MNFQIIRINSWLPLDLFCVHKRVLFLINVYVSMSLICVLLVTVYFVCKTACVHIILVRVFVGLLSIPILVSGQVGRNVVMMCMAAAFV